MPLFPARTKRLLRYHTNSSLTSSAGTVATYVFRANDLFDPDYTSTGHQPMGFDQMMTFYNHFCVDWARIKVQFTNIATGPLHVAVRVDADLTPITSVDQVMEFGGLTTDIVEAKNTYGSNKELTLTVDIPKIQGVSRKAITADPNLCGNAANSPAELTFFHVLVWDPLATGGTVQFDVTLEQRAWFLEPRTSVLSLRPQSEMKTMNNNERRTDNGEGRRNAINAMAEAAYRAVGDRDVRLQCRR